MRLWFTVLVPLVVSLLSVPEVVAQFPPDSFTNLKVLPKDIPRDSLITLMGQFTRALAVRCSHCHVGEESRPLTTYDFASDEKEAKRTARVMMRMVHHINHEHLGELERRVEPAVRVECATCHRGARTPRMLQDILLDAYSAAGIDSTIAAFQNLRTRFYGRFTYDFSAVPLADVATRINAPGRMADAERLMAMNAELFPTSNFALRQHARASIVRAFAESGADSGAVVYARVKAKYGPLVNENLLNTAGHDLLGFRLVDPAIALFTFAVGEFPSSANGFDSLGEAYMIKGDKARAVANYERSLALDPENSNAREKLRQLRQP
jgi:hypothetical protein